MSREFALTIAAELENLKAVRSFVRQSGETLGVTPDAVADLCLVVDEAVSNVIQHGYAGRQGAVDLIVEQDAADLVIRIHDDATPFDPTGVASPDLNSRLADRAFGGMGVHLIRTLTDEATYRSLPGRGNELRLVKRGVLRS